MQDVEQLARQLLSCSDDERIELLRGIQSKEEQLRILHEFAVSLIQISSADDLAWYVAKEVVGRMGFLDCVLYSVDEDRQVLIQQAAIGDKNPSGRTIANKLEIPIGVGVSGRVAKRREPELIDDLLSDQDYVTDINPARSEICVPILHGSELLGVIDSEDPRPHFFTQDHLETLVAVAALTSSKLAELRALEKIELQAQMIESVREAITITDVDGIIIDCNAAASEIYGYSREQLIGQNVSVFYASQEQWQALKCVQVASLEKHGSWRGNIDVRRGDGSSLTMDISLTPSIDEQGQQVATTAVARDITRILENEKAIREQNQALELKQIELEKALADREAARQANAAKDAFLANTSHELRTPLTGVIRMIDLLQQTKVDEEQQQLLVAADTSARSLLGVIDDVLELERIETGKISLVEKPFDIVKAVREVVETLGPAADEKALTIKVKEPDKVDYALLGDVSRVRQILFNIIGNAIKFTGEGSVEVTFDLCRQQDKCALCVCVEDTGIGFAPEQAEQIFERFEQVDASATKNESGTGLGLAISRELAELMGGTLTATGEQGVGAVFRFKAEFDIASVTKTEPQARLGAGVRAAEQPLKVLVAEDNPINQLLVKKLLAPFSWQLTMVSNGREAIERLENGELYDGVLMDIRMPVLDGIQATKHIRQSGQTYATIPIVALTANTMEADRELYQQVGMNAVVGKPINLQALLQAVDVHFVPGDDDGDES